MPRDRDAHRAAVDEMAEVIGREDAARLVGAFLRDLPGRIRAVRDAGDPDGLFRQAHEMAAMAGAFGLDGLCRAAAALETACREGRVEELSARVGDYADAIAHADVLLRETLAALK